MLIYKSRVSAQKTRVGGFSEIKMYVHDEQALRDMLAYVSRIGKKKQTRTLSNLRAFALRYDPPLPAQNKPKVKIMKTVFSRVPTPFRAAIGDAARIDA